MSFNKSDEIQNDLSHFFKLLLDKRKTTIDELDLDLSEELKLKLMANPIKISGKIVGSFFKKINITSEEYSEFILLIKQNSGDQPNKHELNWVKDCELLFSKDKLETIKLTKLINKLLEFTSIIKSLSYSDLFYYHLKFSNYISKYLKKELNLPENFIHESEIEALQNKYFSLPIEVRQEKFRIFAIYFQHILEIRDRDILLNDKVTSIKLYLDKQKWKVPEQDKVFELLEEKGLFLEAYNTSFIQIYRSSVFSTITSHSFIKLETYEWWELFDRSEEDNLKIKEIADKILLGEIKQPIYKCMPKHNIKEINTANPKLSQVEPLVYCPVFNYEGVIQGALHIFKLKIISTI